MDFFQVIEKRRSVRRFSAKPVPKSIIQNSLDAALLAPNSSNAQTWDFYWIQNQDLKDKVAYCCFNQSAAKTASDLVVVTIDPKKWKRSWKPLYEFAKEKGLHRSQISYYKKVFPYTYFQDLFGLAALVKTFLSILIGIWRPVPRWPLTQRQLQELSIKSAALAAENFVLATTAQGYASCMMEGFDEWRLKRTIKLGRSARVAMVIGVGEESPDNDRYPRFRIPKSETVHILDS